MAFLQISTELIVKRIKKNKLDLALVCSFSSVFASVRCFGNSSNANSNVINSPINIINNDTPSDNPLVLDDNHSDKRSVKTDDKVINSAPSGTNNEVRVEPTKPQESNNVDSKFLAPEVIDISNVSNFQSIIWITQSYN